MVDERKQERIFEQIRKEDYEEGIRLGIVKALKSLMKTQNISMEEAMKAIGIPQSEREEYAKRLGVK